MASEQFKVGDKIRVIGYRPGKYPPGYVDDMGTEELFKSLVGRRYTIRGFDADRLDLHPSAGIDLPALGHQGRIHAIP